MSSANLNLTGMFVSAVEILVSAHWCMYRLWDDGDWKIPNFEACIVYQCGNIFEYIRPGRRGLWPTVIVADMCHTVSSRSRLNPAEFHLPLKKLNSEWSVNMSHVIGSGTSKGSGKACWYERSWEGRAEVWYESKLRGYISCFKCQLDPSSRVPD